MLRSPPGTGAPREIRRRLPLWCRQSPRAAATQLGSHVRRGFFALPVGGLGGIYKRSTAAHMNSRLDRHGLHPSRGRREALVLSAVVLQQMSVADRHSGLRSVKGAEVSRKAPTGILSSCLAGLVMIRMLPISLLVSRSSYWVLLDYVVWCRLDGTLRLYTACLYCGKGGFV